MPFSELPGAGPGPLAGAHAAAARILPNDDRIADKDLRLSKQNMGVDPVGSSQLGELLAHPVPLGNFRDDDFQEIVVFPADM